VIIKQIINGYELKVGVQAEASASGKKLALCGFEVDFVQRLRPN